MIQPDTGLAIIGPTARLSRKTVFARARSALVNQARMSTMTQVSTPPSEMPRANRLMNSSVSVWTKLVLNEIRLQNTSSTAMTRFGLQMLARRPAGICSTR